MMGRLIDVDELNAKLRNIHENEKDVINSVWMLNTLIDKVDEIPTAYDPDKVVEHLEDYLFEKHCVEGDSEIERIVKGGGANGN